MLTPLSSFIRRFKKDLIVASGLAILFFVVSFILSGRIDPVIYKQEAMNVWFEGDIPRVHDNLVDRWGDEYRVRVHPLFSLFSYPIVNTLTRLCGVESGIAIRIFFSFVSFLWIGSAFAMFRLMGCRRFDSTLFTLILGVSASSLFWFTVPETYSLGSITIVLTLCFILYSGKQQEKPSFIWFLLINALSLSITVTNWLVGLLASLFYLPWKKAIAACAAALLLVCALWGIQKQIFPYTEFFGQSLKETQYALHPGSGEITKAAPAFFFHSMVMPEFETFNKFKDTGWQVMTVQNSPPGSAGPQGVAAIAVFAALLIMGLWAAFTIKELGKFRAITGIFISAQFVMHFLYGDETFLFSLHFTPILVAIIALCTLTKIRKLSLVLAGLFLVLLCWNNFTQFEKAVDNIKNCRPAHLEQGTPTPVEVKGR